MEHGHYQRRLTFETRRANWLERVLYAAGAIVVVVIGFFFVTVAFFVGALLALAIVARLWWISRKLKQARNQDVVEGEYEVVERSESDRRR
jgi:uncharacterized membrane protein